MNLRFYTAWAKSSRSTSKGIMKVRNAVNAIIMYPANFDRAWTTTALLWLLIAASYGAVITASIQTLLGNWSGLASLGMAFAIVVGTPTLVGNGVYLWRKNLLHGFVRIEGVLCGMLPIAVVLLLALALKLDR
jgi:hypothetical protein